MLDRLLAIAVVAAGLVACGGGEGERPGGEATPGGEAPQRAETPSPAGGPVDPALADQGQQLMQAKGCIACHTIGGGRLVGPDLAGVTERRSDAFIIGMITNPDSMLANDETAKQLLAEYFTPMTNQGITREDAQALLAYLKSSDAE